MSERLITARDCSPLPLLSRDDEEWLKRLLKATDITSCLMPIGAPKADDEPIAAYDSLTGCWRAGRYVGELQFENGVLRIEPRFGMPSLLRWLGEFWGVRLLEGGGALKEQSLWLWLIIAHLWSGRLIAAAKHGLPYKRSDEIHKGVALRGKLLPLQTALMRAVRDDHLVSRTRVRVVDGHIGEIVLLAAQHLNRALRIKGPRPGWLPERGAEILGDLRSALGAHRDETAAHKAHTIRYTPITESYRPLIELSLSILARKPRAPSAGGSAKAYGILLDMAEIWELYVAKLLRAGLPGHRVLHTGRVSQSFKSLLKGQSGQMLGSLRPDILIQDEDEECLGIADAKYKNTRVRPEHINGVVREDLYQLAAYLSGFGDQEKDLDGFLIYPEDLEGQVSLKLAPNNPWQFTAGSRRKLWFLSVNGTDTPASTGMTNNEQILLNQIEAALLRD